MSSYEYDRLSAQDNDFLVWETPSLPMHVGGTNIFDAGPLRNEHGGIDFEALKQLTESILHRMPRYRQKLAWIPGESHAVWVDDEHFNLDYHFRHTGLPRPGTDDQLKLLTAQLMEHPLDRSRPLWETWVVEGLEGDRFATVNKIHHCMIDGASGMNLFQLLMSRTPEREIHSVPGFIPRPEPSGSRLKRDERMRKLALPFRVGRAVLEWARETPDIGGEIMHRGRSLVGLAKRMAFPVSSTPINGPVGPHRIVDWAEIPFADVRAVKRALDCTVNDVVLATVTGAIRSLMQSRQVNPDTLDFRVSTPVNLRRESDGAISGNQVSAWIVRLPLDEAKPLAQLRVIRETTSRLKESDEAGVVKLVVSALEGIGLDVQNLSVGTMNTVVTNVPGPPFPLYMLGAELLQMMPFAPLLNNLGLTIGVLTYNGKMFWGLNGDVDRLPDLADFRVAIERAFRKLAAAAGVKLASVPPPTPSFEVPAVVPEARVGVDPAPERAAGVPSEPASRTH